jgi:hypothetical protein
MGGGPGRAESINLTGSNGARYGSPEMTEAPPGTLPGRASVLSAGGTVSVAV